MAGYNHYLGMSNNAVAAYHCGIKPITKITREDLQSVDLAISKAFAIWLVQENHWKACEWHHSGGRWYNTVNFYDVNELAEAINDGSLDLFKLKKIYDSQRNSPATGLRVSGSYTVWGGTRNRPVNEGEKTFTGTKIGNWILIDGGGRKKANGNHINWRANNEPTIFSI